MKRIRLDWCATGWELALLLIAPMTLMADETLDEVPSQAFLEFLGEWEDAQGNWQDPLEYETPGDALSAQDPGTNVEQNDETP